MVRSLLGRIKVGVRGILGKGRSVGKIFKYKMIFY